MELSNRNLMIIGLCIGSYLILSDMFSKPTFALKVSKLLGNTVTANHTHTLIEMVGTSANTLAGFLSFSFGLIIRHLPQILKDPRAMVYSIFGAIGLSFLKAGSFISIGFHKNNTANTVDGEKNSKSWFY